MVMNHSLSQGLSSLAESYISLGNSGRPAKVTGRRGSPLPRWAVASTASHTWRAEAPRPGHEDVPRVAPAEAPRWCRWQPEADTRRRLPQLWQAWPLGQGVSTVMTRPGPHRTGGGGSSSAPTHASIELSPAASATTALLHFDEPRAHALLDDGSINDKTDEWCLYTGSTHHMTGR
jgi:hypothetical protein